MRTHRQLLPDYSLSRLIDNLVWNMSLSATDTHACFSFPLEFNNDSS
jgi:hypothetical protein